jgi:beta-hydroxylase
MFVNPADFNFTRVLVDHWLAIQREFDALPAQALRPWHDRHLYDDDGWSAFGIYAFGRRVSANCALCPETTRILEQLPGMRTAGFSRLAGGTHIRPHAGLARGVLRCHLGLHMPEGCELRVGSETRSLHDGECIVFDDTAEHEAWNRSEAARVVLLVDFKRDPASFHPKYALLDWVDRTRFTIFELLSHRQG